MTPSGARVEEQLVREFTPLAYGIARDFYAPGSTAEDVRQEALAGVLGGVRSFDPSLGVPLDRFVALTVRRQLMSFVKLARRLKHGPLNDSLRVSENEEGETVAIVELVADARADTHRLVVARGEIGEFHDSLSRLSRLERRAIVGSAVGMSYAEIGGATDQVTFRRVDNGYMRARRKLRAAVADAA